MQKNPHSQSGIFTPRVLAAFVLCLAGVALTMLSLAATPPLSGNAKAGTARMPLAPSTTGGWSIFNSPSALSTLTNDLSAVTCSSASDCWAVGGDNGQTLIEHWNGTSWSIVTSPNAGPQSNQLSSVTCASASDCWAAGYYYPGSGGNRPQTLIEHWNGSSWAIVTSPNTSTTDDNYLNGVTCTSSFNCWAVGYYAGANPSRTLIEHWNGSSWAIVSSPNDPSGNGSLLYSVTCASASACWAVGNGSQTLIERWNGSSWVIVTSPSGGFLYGVTCASASDCWAVGDTGNGSAVQTLTEHWNGNAWSVVTSPNAGTIADILGSVTCASASDCWAVGDYNTGADYKTLIEHWNGTSWTIVISPNASGTTQNNLNGVTCSSASDCWAVGSYFNNSDIAQTLTQHWNGTSWTIVASPNIAGTITNELFGLTCASASECWAVGYYLNQGQFPLIEQWNGTSWTIASAAPRVNNDQLHGVICASASECWAVGEYEFFSGVTDYFDTLIEQWNGTSWARVTSPNASVYHNFLNGVACASTSDCWAVGYYDVGFHGAGPHQTLIQQWDGNSWTVVTSPNSGSAQNSVLRSVTCASASDCWAVGNDRNGSDSHTLIEHWNGSAWAIVNSPNASNAATPVNVLTSITCPSASDCWAAGFDTISGGIIQTLIEHWNGSVWLVVTSPNTDTTRTNELKGVTCTSASDCWAVGDYNNNSAIAQTLIEHWNGSSWAIVTSPNTSSTRENKLNGVTCSSASECWAAGHYFNDSGIQQTLIERWTPGAVQLVSAVSRKTHGSAGTFDINLPVTGNPGIECRTGGRSGNHQLIATFALPVTMTGASVVSGTGSVSTTSVNGSQITVNLTGVTNAQTILIRLAGVSDGTNSSNFDIPMGVLLGDTSANGSVNATDVSQTKTQSGQSATTSNFREDVSVNGVINSTDVGIVKAGSGTALP